MKNIIVLFLLISSSTIATAQRGQVEKTLQQKYMEQYGQPGANKFGDYMSNTFGGKTEDSYSFPLYLNMHIVEYKGSKKDETDVKYYVDAQSKNFAFGGITNGKSKNDAKDMTMIFDYKNSSIIMLNDDNKSAMAINFSMFTNSAQFQKRTQQTYDDHKVKCSKSGKTKTIQGYNCTQYQCVDIDDADSRADIWVSADVPVDIQKSSSFGLWSMNFMNVAGMGGMMMEGQFYEKDKLKSSVEITEINKTANYQVNMSDYQMGFGGTGGR